MIPAELAATVRKTLDESREFFNIEVDAAHAALDALEAQAARVEELEAALDDACDVAIWLTGAADLSDVPAWPAMKEKLGRARAALDKDKEPV